MKQESNLVLEIWEMVRDHLPNNKRLDTAIGIVRAFEEFGMESKDLQDIVDEEPYLTKAFREVFEDQEDDHQDEYSEED